MGTVIKIGKYVVIEVGATDTSVRIETNGSAIYMTFEEAQKLIEAITYEIASKTVVKQS